MDIIIHLQTLLQVSSSATLQFPRAMLNTESSPQSDGIPAVTMTQPQDVDMTLWSEAEFEEKCTYIVKDQPLEQESESDGGIKAKRTLPRNLALKCRNGSTEVSSNLCANRLLGLLYVSSYSDYSLRQSGFLPSTHPSSGRKYSTCCCLISALPLHPCVCVQDRDNSRAPQHTA